MRYNKKKMKSRKTRQEKKRNQDKGRSDLIENRGFSHF